ncbi:MULTISPECIES: DNA polymerase III subunit chi [unclassified Yoonia]|uniref:DNA polymerase III subunit chi n=1 Tax=unclassified Yoonia TaxID=2629118 RepID=UPI002AFE9E82|nr:MULTISPECIES: DNA polymerase III subunit chi [unclassified Yoonia]
MGAVFFYELQGAPLEATLPMLLDKARGQGWRVLVRSTDPALLAHLDAALWQGPVESFLPHGMAGGPHDADQPILLGDVPADGFACVMAVGGAAVTADEANRLARACILFDSAESAKAQARVQWKSLTDAGIAAQYWAQEDGRWVKKAERDARSAG